MFVLLQGSAGPTGPLGPPGLPGEGTQGQKVRLSPAEISFHVDFKLPTAED